MTFLRTRGKLGPRNGIWDRENIHQGGEDAERNKQGSLCLRVAHGAWLCGTNASRRCR